MRSIARSSVMLHSVCCLDVLGECPKHKAGQILIMGCKAFHTVMDSWNITAAKNGQIIVYEQPPEMQAR